MDIKIIIAVHKPCWMPETGDIFLCMLEGRGNLIVCHKKAGCFWSARFLNKGQYGLVAYVLKNTLFDNGGVARGIYTVKNGDKEDYGY